MIRRLQRIVDEIKITSPLMAGMLCKIIPGSCPFERTLRFFAYTIHVPSVCKLNPLYEQLVSLRFRASVYLAQH